MKRVILKFTAILLFATLLSNCSRFTYLNGSKSQISLNPKFYVNDVSTKVSEKRIFPLGLDSDKNDLMTEKEMNQFVRDEIINALRRDNLYSDSPIGDNVYECNFNAKFIKNYYMFTNFKYARTSLGGYEVSVLKDGKVIATSGDGNEYIVTGNGMGFAASFRAITMRVNRDDENKMVGILSRSIASNMKDFGK